MTQAEVAERLQCAPNTVCNWETGDRTPRATDLNTLADLYDCTSDYLLCRSEHSTQLPLGELLIDHETVESILSARTEEQLYESVDWDPQMVMFWYNFRTGTRVGSRQKVNELTTKLVSHIRSIAPRLWREYEEARQQFKQSQVKSWSRIQERRNSAT